MKLKQNLNVRGCLLQLLLTIIIFIASIYLLPFIVKENPKGDGKFWGLGAWGLILSYWPYLLTAAILFIIHFLGKTTVKTTLKVLPDGSTKLKSPAFITICKTLSIVVASLAAYGISISIGYFIETFGKILSIGFLSFAIGFSYNALNLYIIVSESSIQIKSALGIEILTRNDIKKINISDESIYLITKYCVDENGNETKSVYNQSIIDCASRNVTCSKVEEILIKYGYLSGSEE
jgi:hypothetical protein